MLHKNVTPPLPNTEYIQSMLSTLKSNIHAVINSKNEFYNYFTYTLQKEGKIAPKEFEKLYDQLDSFGTSFVKCLEEFISLIEPTLKTTANLNSKRSELAKSLDEYQRRIVIVRKEMTEANIKAEGQKLQVFAKNLSEFNKESNDYKHYLLKLYLSACFQLEQGLESALHMLNKAIESPEEISLTQEEKELDDYIRQLNEQIAIKNEKEKKAKEEALKAQKEKEEKEKQKIEEANAKKEEEVKNKEEIKEKEEAAEEKKEVKAEEEENEKQQKEEEKQQQKEEEKQQKEEEEQQQKEEEKQQKEEEKQQKEEEEQQKEDEKQQKDEKETENNSDNESNKEAKNDEEKKETDN